VNEDTIEFCPDESTQFGRALLRILQHIAQSDPCLGPINLSKIDISDGFYRIAIRPDDIPKLVIMFPIQDGEEQLNGLSLVLTMGWKYSPPLFTATTETVADLTNAKLQAKVSSQAHCLDAVSESPIKLEIPSLVSRSGPAPLSLPAPATRLHTRPRRTHVPIWSSHGMCMLMTLSAWCREVPIIGGTSSEFC
jgi:hypothetical protein